MNQDLGFYLRQDERGDWLYCEDGEERAATLPERVLWKAQAQQAAYVPAFRTSLAYDVGFKDGKKAAECVDQFCACRGGPGAECPEGDAVAAQAQQAAPKGYD